MKMFCFKKRETRVAAAETPSKGKKVHPADAEDPEASAEAGGAAWQPAQIRNASEDFKQMLCNSSMPAPHMPDAVLRNAFQMYEQRAGEACSEQEALLYTIYYLLVLYTLYSEHKV